MSHPVITFLFNICYTICPKKSAPGCILIAADPALLNGCNLPSFTNSRFASTNFPFPFFFFTATSPLISSSKLNPNSSLIAIRLATSGIPLSISHLVIACPETFNFSASCSCERPACFPYSKTQISTINVLGVNKCHFLCHSPRYFSSNTNSIPEILCCHLPFRIVPPLNIICRCLHYIIAVRFRKAADYPA